MNDRKNGIRLDALAETREKIVRGEVPPQKPFEVEGRWRSEGPGMFEATLAFPGGTLTLVSDQPPPSGGEGIAPNPVQYCVYAMLACYATTFMTLAAKKGVEIRGLKCRGASVANMKAIFEVEEGPIIDRVWIELEVDSDASDEVLEALREEADRKCPAAYTVQNAVPFASRLVKKEGEA